MHTRATIHRDTIVSCIESACRAPSIHNSQPWRWDYTNGKISLLPDATRLLQTDPQGRQLVMSCGAVLNHLGVALRNAGVDSSVSRFPMDGTPAPIAIISVQPGQPATTDDTELLRAISRRRSDRRPFRSPQFEGSGSQVLGELSEFGIIGVILSPKSRDAIASASAMSAAVHRYDSVYQHEIHWWAGHDRASDGIPRTLLGDADSVSAVDGRSFPVGTLKPTGLGADDADWVLLYAAEDSPESWLHAGEALSSVLLRATTLDYATCTVSHVLQDPESRELLRLSLPPAARLDACAQILIRIGATESIPLTTISPRRPVREVMTIPSPTDEPS